MLLVEIVNNSTNNNKLTTLAGLRPLSLMKYLSCTSFRIHGVFFGILMSYTCLSGICCVICNILWLTIWSFFYYFLSIMTFERCGERYWIIHESRRRLFMTIIHRGFLVLIIWIDCDDWHVSSDEALTRIYARYWIWNIYFFTQLMCSLWNNIVI